jgi:hypothetical protein
LKNVKNLHSLLQDKISGNLFDCNASILKCFCDKEMQHWTFFFHSQKLSSFPGKSSVITDFKQQQQMHCSQLVFTSLLLLKSIQLNAEKVIASNKKISHFFSSFILMSIPQRTRNGNMIVIEERKSLLRTIFNEESGRNNNSGTFMQHTLRGKLT